MQYKYLKLGDIIPEGAEWRNERFTGNNWRKSTGIGKIWDAIEVGEADSEYRVKINKVIITETGEIEYDVN